MTNRIFYGWWIVSACFLIALYVSTVVFFGFTAFFEPLVEEFGWSYTQISFATSLRGLEMGIMSPLIGFLVDRFGSRRLMFFGVITVGLGLILLGFTGSLPMFYCAILFISFGSGGCTSVVTMTVVANWFRRNLGKALGLMSSGFGASGLLLPLVILLIDTYGWRTAVITLGVVMWVLGISLTLVIRDKPEQLGLNPDGMPPDESTLNSGGEQVSISFREALRDRSFLYLCIAEAIRFMAVAAVVIHIMPYLSSEDISRGVAGLIAAAVPLSSIAGRFAFGWLSDIFEARRVMAVAFGFIAVGLLAFCCVGAGWLPIILFLLFFSPGFGGIAVLRGAIIIEYYGRNFFGKMIGITMGFAAIGGIIGPTLTGWIFDQFGKYYFTWLGFSGCSILAVLLILRMKHVAHVSASAETLKP
jgi:sugar phosphate permease